MPATPFLPGLSPVGARSITATFRRWSFVFRRRLDRVARDRITSGLSAGDCRPLARHVSCTATLAHMLMIAAGHEELRRCSAVPTLWVNCPSRTLQTGARWPVSGSVGIDLYCRSFVRPRRIILDMDDIDDPNRNSPCCAVTATTAPSPALVLPGAMCRDYTLDTHGHRRVLHHHQPSKGATRRSTKSVLAHERI